MLRVLLTVFTIVLFASGSDAQILRQRLRDRFDRDGDGRLSRQERAAARQALLDGGEDPDGRKLLRRTWTIDGVEREALIYPPKDDSTEPVPLVFGFHGHGGTATRVARSYAFQRHWPEALVVYMQGIPTPGPLTDPEGKRNGWQHAIGEQEDRDLKFFDAVLATMRKERQVDNSRIYASGHSNGGGFTYVLWSARGKQFAALAPSAAGSRSLRTHTPEPRPIMHIAGEHDPLVRFEMQQRTMRRVQQINHCEETGHPWAKQCTLYASSVGAPFVAMIHPGTHAYPQDAPPLIVKFFKQHTRKLDTPSNNSLEEEAP